MHDERRHADLWKFVTDIDREKRSVHAEQRLPINALPGSFTFRTLFDAGCAKEGVLNARESYTQALQDQFGLGDGYHVLWPVGAATDPGDIGRIQDGAWIAEGRLQQRGIKAPREQDPYNLVTQDFTSTSGVSISAKLSGETDASFSYVASAEAGVRFAFSKKNAVAISLRNVNQKRVSDVNALAKEMKKAFHEKRMDYGTLVVTHVLQAKWALVLVSGSSNSSAELVTNAKIGKGPVQLGSIKGKVGWRHYEDMAAKGIAEAKGGFAVAYRLLAIDHKGIFWWREVVVRAAAAQNQPRYLTRL